MKIKTKLKHFLRYEGKILILTFVLIIIAGCISWNSFFRTPSQQQIQRDYLIENIADEYSFNPKLVKKYSNNQLEIVSRLGLNGLISLESYPQATERLYNELKEFQTFYDIINEFGPQHTIPALDYFYEEGNFSTALEQKLSDFVTKLFDKQVEADTLSQRQKRLLLILNEIQYQRHNFLARFVYTEQGAKRNYVSTTTSALLTFFTGGLSNFNEAVVTKGITKVSTAELVDAGIDIIVLIPFAVWFSRSAKSGLKALKGGGVITATEKSALRQTSLAAVKPGRFARISRVSKGVWKTIPLRTLFKFRYVKWYILGLAIVKPSLINHAATLIARAISVPPIFIKTGFWFMIIFPLLNLIIPTILFFKYLWKKIKPKLYRAAV